jgi:hypothetical protein
MSGTVHRERIVLKLSVPSTLLRLIDTVRASSNITDADLEDLFGDPFLRMAQSVSDEFASLATHESGYVSAPMINAAHDLLLVFNEATPLAELEVLARGRVDRVHNAYAVWPEGIRLDSDARSEACDNNNFMTQWLNDGKCRQKRLEYFTNWTLAQHENRLSQLEYGIEYRSRLASTMFRLCIYTLFCRLSAITEIEAAALLNNGVRPSAS